MSGPSSLSSGAVLLTGILLFGLMLLADPAAMHLPEILEPVTVGYEYQRGNLALADLPLALNGEISLGVALVYTGFFRCFGTTYPAIMAVVLLQFLLLLTAWHLLIRTTVSRPAATWTVLLLAAAPPAFLLLVTQIDFRHVEVNLLIPLSLLLLLGPVRNGHRPATLLLALLLVFGLAITRTAWIHLATILLLLPRLAHRRRFLICLLGAAAVYYWFPPAGGGAAVRMHQWPLTQLAAERFSLPHTSQLAAALPRFFFQGLGLSKVAAAFFFLSLGMAVVATIGRLPRLKSASPQAFLFRYLLLYPLLYLVALLLLRLDGHFNDWYAPPWWRFRYLISPVPLGCVLIACWLGSLRPRSRGLLGCLLMMLSLVSLPAVADFRFQPLGSYSPHNYRIFGEMVSRRLSPGTIGYWQQRFARIDRPHLPSLIAGCASAAASPEVTVEQARLIRELVPPDWRIWYYTAAGYWAGEYQNQRHAAQVRAMVIEPGERDAFDGGWRHSGNRYAWWYIYNRDRMIDPPPTAFVQ